MEVSRWLCLVWINLMTASLPMAAENDWLRSMVEATFSP